MATHGSIHTRFVLVVKEEEGEEEVVEGRVVESGNCVSGGVPYK